MVQLFTNFAESTLQQGVEASTTTLFIDSTQAGNFPAPAGGDFAVGVIFDQHNSSNAPEIFRITARSGGQLTVIRGQESTAAQEWSAGASVYLALTASVIESILNQVAVQTSWTGNAVGSAAYTLTVVGALPIPANGDEVVFIVPNTNTGNGTLTITNGSGNVGPFPIFNNDGTQLDPGDFAAGFMAVLRWSSADGAWRVVSTASAQVIATAINDGPLTPANIVSGGNFDQWSAASFSTPSNGTETAENAFVIYDGSIGTFSVSRQAFATGQTEVENDPVHFLRWNHSVAGSGSTFRALQMHCRAKNGVFWRNGDQAILSFYAKADAARNIIASVFQNFGTGGSPSGAVTAGTAVFALTTSWQKFTLLVNLPSIATKVLGSNLNHLLIVGFDLPLNTTMVIDLAMVQLEPGPRATLPWALFPLPLQYGGTGVRADTNAELGTKLGVLLIANLLTSILAIDGAGSGIDADLLDGLNSTNYVQTSGAQSIAGTKTFTTAPVFDIAGGGAWARFSRNAGVTASIFLQTGTAASGQRWGLAVENTAESGANAGSNFVLSRYDDAGLFVANPITIVRSSGLITLVAPLHNAVGSAGAVAYGFTGDGDTGMYSTGADALAWATGGTGRMFLNSFALSIVPQARGSDGSAGSPSYSFASDPDTGLFLAGTDTIGFSAGGSSRFSISAATITGALPYRNQAGSAALPAYSFSGDVNSGIYSISDDNIGVSTGGTLRATFAVTALSLAAAYDLRLDATTEPGNTTSVGFRGAPVVSGNSAYNLAMADAGKTIYHDETTARTWTIPANASVAFPIGTVIILDNTGNGGGTPGVITLNITTDTLRRGDGVAGTGSRTIPANGVAAIRKTKSNEWVITGTYT